MMKPLPSNCQNVELYPKNANKTLGYRYVYKVEFSMPSNNGKYLIVICMNPSEANSTHVDSTIELLIINAQRLNYKGLYVLNVLPYYETQSKVLFDNIKNDKYYTPYRRLNVKIVVTTIKYHLNDDILLACGTKVFDDTPSDVLSILRVLCKIRHKTNIYYLESKRNCIKKYPPHPDRRSAKYINKGFIMKKTYQIGTPSNCYELLYYYSRAKKNAKNN